MCLNISQFMFKPRGGHGRAILDLAVTSQFVGSLWSGGKYAGKIDNNVYQQLLLSDLFTSSTDQIIPAEIWSLGITFKLCLHLATESMLYSRLAEYLQTFIISLFISSTTWLQRWTKTPLRRPTLRLWLTITASNGNNQTSLTVINRKYCQGHFYLQGQHTWSHCERVPIQWV